MFGERPASTNTNEAAGTVEDKSIRRGQGWVVGRRSAFKISFGGARTRSWRWRGSYFVVIRCAVPEPHGGGQGMGWWYVAIAYISYCTAGR